MACIDRYRVIFGCVVGEDVLCESENVEKELDEAGGAEAGPRTEHIKWAQQYEEWGRRRFIIIIIKQYGGIGLFQLPSTCDTM